MYVEHMVNPQYPPTDCLEQVEIFPGNKSLSSFSLRAHVSQL